MVGDSNIRRFVRARTSGKGVVVLAKFALRGRVVINRAITDWTRQSVDGPALKGFAVQGQLHGPLGMVLEGPDRVRVVATHVQVLCHCAGVPREIVEVFVSALGTFPSLRKHGSNARGISQLFAGRSRVGTRA